MLKKILLTALVIFLAYLMLRWRQKKTAQVAAAENTVQKQNTLIYYLAGAVVTIMIAGLVAWTFYTLN